MLVQWGSSHYGRMDVSEYTFSFVSGPLTSSGFKTCKNHIQVYTNRSGGGEGGVVKAQLKSNGLRRRDLGAFKVC